MQFYAFDEKKCLIHAKQAKKNLNYHCIECQTRVRLRGGLHRQLHFYHLDSTRSCHLRQKGMIHLELQNKLAKILPTTECQLEYRFPSIKRIADVAWLSKKIIFEIQCSPISALEIKARNQDYQSQGWTVIWILHDRRYNQKFLSPAEKALENHPHYFTNMNAKGEGIIYDQFEIIEKSLRVIKMKKMAVDLAHPRSIETKVLQEFPLLSCQQRAHYWPISFEGDLLNLQDAEYYQTALDFEQHYYHQKRKQTLKQIGSYFLNHFIVYPYRVFFRYLLEKACR